MILSDIAPGSIDMLCAACWNCTGTACCAEHKLMLNLMQISGQTSTKLLIGSAACMRLRASIILVPSLNGLPVFRGEDALKRK